MTQKPTIRPVPRVEKAAAVGGSDSEGRVRWSTSSAPRGRSQSPSEFIRVFSDLKKDRVSIDRENKGFRDSTGKGSKEGGGFRESLVTKVKENEGKVKGVRVSDGNCKKDAKFSSDLGKPNGVNIQNEGFGAFNENCISDFDSELGACIRVDEKCDAKFLKEKSLSDGKSLVISKEKDLSVQMSEGSGAAIKYPSKLHEKLAFLEGKVKRIASDIKRTKEMLDMNNPDASKVILSDIQDKISGIEKAMGNVVSDSNGKSSGSKGSGDEEVSTKEADGSQSKRVVGNVKISVKDLNSEELEARLFPHHKLLRNRTSLKKPSGSSQSHEPSENVESGCKVRDEKKLLSSIEDNPIALEFLASLDKQSQVTTRNELATMENSDTQDMDGGGGGSGAQGPSKNLFVKHGVEFNLESDEILEDFDDQENKPTSVIDEESEDASIYPLNEIGRKMSTGGWFVSEGEAALLAHDDGSCSFYDITNCEVFFLVPV